MKIKIISFLGGLAWILTLTSPSPAAMESRAADPYLGAIVIDAGSGQVLVADHADEKGCLASVLKLMNLLVVLEHVQAGALRLDDKVIISAEAAKIGGSQVYLKENEVFTVDELLYALMVQSANDAATALAVRTAGSKEGFVALMNQRALALGMKSTVFYSVHGLPPDGAQLPDTTTARDIARLSRELLKHSDCLRYTACREHGFRNDQFIMRNHNRLLASFPGCDGLKTGYFRKAGYSIAATAKRGDERIIAVVLGSKSRITRDKTAAELLARGFAIMAQKRSFAPRAAPLPDEPPPPEKETPRARRGLLLVIPLVVLAAGAITFYWHFFRPRK
ncbi:MAG: D-alanyl-D-alanine carboxypeptidase [Kiritimatiellae bacterium]|nr:D-alanyl-D-alanine carboxypeptidase [Kiritimatiellia bacterium]